MCLRRYPEAVATIRASMKLWRRAVYPTAPATLLELSYQLAEPQNQIILQYHSGELTPLIIRDENNEMHIGFCDRTFLRHVEQDINIFFMDSTHQTTPNMDGQLQLFTLMGIYNKHVSNLPIFVELLFLNMQISKRFVIISSIFFILYNFLKNFFLRLYLWFGFSWPEKQRWPTEPYVKKFDVQCLLLNSNW